MIDASEIKGLGLVHLLSMKKLPLGASAGNDALNKDYVGTTISISTKNFGVISSTKGKYDKNMIPEGYKVYIISNNLVVDEKSGNGFDIKYLERFLDFIENEQKNTAFVCCSPKDEKTLADIVGSRRGWEIMGKTSEKEDYKIYNYTTAPEIAQMPPK